MAVIIITHKLDEVFEISDTISILRNGQHVGTIKNGELSRLDAVKMMLGRDVSSQFPEVINTATEKIILDIKNLSDESGRIRNLNMYVKEGEVVGVYGLLGSGRTELLEAVFGLSRCKGSIQLEGQEIHNKKKPEDMIKKGVFLVPEDRRHNSLFREFYTLVENVSIGYMDKISRFKFVSRAKEKELFKKVSDNSYLRVKYARESQDIEELSGGNQQKLVLGRWIFRDNLKVLLLDEPTQGIDVGVKHDIYLLLRNLAKNGKSIVIISSELPELTGVCDRIYVLKDGNFKAEIERAEFSDEQILEMVL